MTNSYNMSPTKLHTNSFELENDGFLLDGQVNRSGTNSKNKLTAYQTINQPQCFWSTNGIAYEVTAASSNSILSGKQASAALVSRESIRAKMDSVLYSVGRRIRYIFSQGYEMTDFEFSDTLTAQIVILNAYLEDQMLG